MAEAEFDRALDHLRENKVRLTPQRKTILNYLINHHTHPSVEMIYDDLKDSVANISMATVYNTLKLFVDYNLVIELKMVMVVPTLTISAIRIIMSSAIIVVRFLMFLMSILLKSRKN